jgi:hypothetical protein
MAAFYLPPHLSYPQLWNIIEGTELFTQVEHPNSDYNSASHLAEMIALFGPPPKEVIERSNYFSQHEFDYPITLEPGRPCKNIREIFCGPHFDEEGLLTPVPETVDAR